MSTVPDRSGHPKRYIQLPMWIPAKELHSSAWTKDDSFWNPDNDDLMAQKLEESKTYPLYDDIKKQGIHTPVEVNFDRKAVVEGHHRIAVANDLNPDYPVPVEHTDWS